MHPIVNFHNDTEIDWRKSLLIVHALEKMTESARDYVDDTIKADGGKQGSLISKVAGLFV